jgi:hypothetical protein
MRLQLPHLSDSSARSLLGGARERRLNLHHELMHLAGRVVTARFNCRRESLQSRQHTHREKRDRNKNLFLKVTLEYKVNDCIEIWWNRASMDVSEFWESLSWWDRPESRRFDGSSYLCCRTYAQPILCAESAPFRLKIHCLLWCMYEEV